MLHRIGRGWPITKASWAIHRAQPERLLFPNFLRVIGIGAVAGVDAATAVVLTAVPYAQALMAVFAALGRILRLGTYIFATTGKALSCMDPVRLQTALRKQQGSP